MIASPRAALIAGLLVGCGSRGVRPTPEPLPPASSEPSPEIVTPLMNPGLRLPRDLAIERYEVALTLDPAQPTMSGRVAIVGRLAKPTAVLWLHAEGMTFGDARVATDAGDIPLEVVPGLGRGRIALRAAVTIPAGAATVTIDYIAKLQDTETEGTFRQQSSGDWYAFTQHEAIAARRSVPCLDEPDVKVPWKLRLTVPATTTAVGNAPIELDVVAGGLRHVTFAATEPIPSYLFAYAVGPFEYVDAGTSSHGAPLRIVALRGRSRDAAFAAESTPKILAEMERWFGTPYPFAKLDALAIPMTVGFSAMENPGLITYRESLLLVPAHASDRRRETYVAVAAHELAHQWFGDLVTPAWWDDLWLNESFASWLPERVIAATYPRWAQPEKPAIARDSALEADSLGTGRAVRQPIAAEDDIVTAFDGITYGKGAAVLRMLEAWVGPERFQTGVRAYLAAHARRNATAHDFISAIAAQAPELAVPAVAVSLLDQAGAPRLTAHTECPDGGPARVTLVQSRYLPLGATSAAAPRWHLPVCVRAGVGGKLVTACTVLAGGDGAATLPGCPTWMWPNAGGGGYYRTTLDADGWRAVRSRGWANLDASERLAVAQDLVAAVAAGDAGVDVALELVPTLVAGSSRPMVLLAVKIITVAAPWIPEARRPAFAAWIRRQLGPLARKLGWTPRAGEAVDADRLRVAVVPLVADAGADQGLRRAAVAKMRAWWTLPESIRGDLVWTAVRARPKLHDGLFAPFRNEQDRSLRDEMARALGAVPEPKRLAAALALLLDPTLDIRVTAPILTSALGRIETRDFAAAFALEHLDELIARLPGDTALSLVSSLTASCDAAKQAPMRALAVAKLGSKRGAARRIDQGFERMSQCIARRAADEPVLAAWAAKLPRR